MNAFSRTRRIATGLVVIVVVAGITSPIRAEEASTAFSEVSFESALKKAQEEHKIVFVDFFTSWCGPCKRLDATTWRDPVVIALLNEKTVALKVDAEKNAELAKRYSIEAYPTLALIRPDGTMIDTLIGYQDAKTFTGNFNSALAGKTSLMRATEAVKKASSGNIEGQVDARYNLGQELAHKGQNAEALNEYLWCFDEGMKEAKGYDGVRVSFLLSDLSCLAKQYPPALEALKARRDKALAKLSASSTDAGDAQDFSSINHCLGNDQATLSYFDTLPRGSSRRAAVGQYIFDLLLQAQRYDDAVDAQPYVRYKAHLKNFKKALKDSPQTEADSLREYIVVEAAKEIEALAGARNLADARDLLRRTLQFDHSAATTTTLNEHLQRVGRADLLKSYHADN